MARRKKTIAFKRQGAGQPPKAKAGDAQSMEEAAYRTAQKFDARVINDLPEHYKRLEMIAKGEGEFAKASITARKTATEWIIARAEDYLYEEMLAEEEENNNTPVNMGMLIDLNAASE